MTENGNLDTIGDNDSISKWGNMLGIRWCTELRVEMWCNVSR